MLSVLVGVCVAILLYFAQVPILDAFTALTEETRVLADKFIVVLCFGIVIRAIPITLIVECFVPEVM